MRTSAKLVFKKCRSLEDDEFVANEKHGIDIFMGDGGIIRMLRTDELLESE